MPHEVVTVQIGGAGNRLGAAWWRKLTTELGVDIDGTELDWESVGCQHGAARRT